MRVADLAAELGFSTDELIDACDEIGLVVNRNTDVDVDSLKAALAARRATGNEIRGSATRPDRPQPDTRVLRASAAPRVLDGGVVTPSGLPLSSVGKRFGSYLLEGLLVFVTLVIGWLIWTCFTFAKGQTPAKQLMGMRCVKRSNGDALTWGGMFLREVIWKGLVVGFLSLITLGIVGIVAPLMILGGDLRQTMWDRFGGTLVVDDPEGIAL